MIDPAVQAMIERYHQRNGSSQIEELHPAEAQAREVIHASATWQSDPLCGQAATALKSAVLALDHPLARDYRHTVNCQDCLEWMHA